MGIKNSIQGFGKWLFNIKEQKSVSYPLDEELIRRDQIIKAQQQQIQARDTQLGKIKATERQKKEEQKGEEYSQEIAKRLNKKEKEIRKKRFTHTFSLRKFMNLIGNQRNPSKFGRKIEITDKDFKTTFGYFGDLVISDNGYLLITDHKSDIIHYARNMSQLVWKPEALSNYMKMNRIPLAVDEDMNPSPDFEEEEHPDVMYFKDEVLKNRNGKPVIDKKTGEPVKGVYKETEIRQRPVKQMLIQREERIRKMQGYTERLEKMNIDKDHKIQDQDREIKALSKRIEVLNVDRVKSENLSMETNKIIGEVHEKVTKLTELNAIHENMLTKKDEIIKTLIDKMRKHGEETDYEDAKQEVKEDIEFYQKVLPKERIVEPSETEKIREIAQPGQPLGKTR